MRRILTGSILSLVLAAAPVAAQWQPESPLSLEPYAGVFHDSYDISPDGESTGAQVGLRLGYELGSRTRLLADVAYVTTHDVSDPAGLESYFVYDNRWALTTVGAEYDVLPGRTSVALGLRAGVGWRRPALAGRVGDPPAYTDVYSRNGFTPMDVVVPTITLRREIWRGTAVHATLADHMFDVLEGPVDHSPALSLGLSLR